MSERVQACPGNYDRFPHYGLPCDMRALPLLICALPRVSTAPRGVSHAYAIRDTRDLWAMRLIFKYCTRISDINYNHI